MAKLYFRYGSVGSAKTLNLLAVAHAYRQQDKNVILVKPALDDRFGAQQIKSRAGLVQEADILVEPGGDLGPMDFASVHCVLVDEAQFLEPHIIEQLRVVASEERIPVICYGLRTDFRGRLFEGSKRLMELADAIEEIKTTCTWCSKKAVFNLKLLDGAPTLEGPVVDLGAEEKYVPACARCFAEKHGGPFSTRRPDATARQGREGAPIQ